MTVVRAGHPLCGQRLVVDGRGGNRRDGNVQVVLPDGSPALISIAWTDAGAQAVSQARGGTAHRFSVTGLRRLLRLVDAMSSNEGEESSRP